MKSFSPLLILLFLFICFNSFSQTQISGIVNEYRKVILTDSAKGYVRLANAGGMTQYIGRTAMLIQMKGATINSTSQSAAFGDVTNISYAGNFEFGVICG